MKLAVCEKDLPGCLRENLEWLSRNGFEGFQIWKGKLDGEGLSASDCLDVAGDLGLEVSAVGGGPNLVDPAVAVDSIAKFKSFLDLSVELGPKIVTAETKRKPRDLPEDEARRSTTETVTTICAYAEEVGAVLAIECAGACFVRDHEMWLELAERVGSPALKVNLDPANIMLAGKDAAEAVRALGPHIVHAHAKDVKRLEGDRGEKHEELRDVPAGEGLVDYPAWLAALKDAGYEGYLTIEMHSGTMDRRDDILAAASNLRSMLETGGRA